MLRAASDEADATRIQVHADHERFPGGPGFHDGMVAPVHFHLLVDAFGGAAQRQFAQRDQIALAKKVSSACRACSGI